MVLATIDTEIVVVLIFLVIYGFSILFKSRSSYFTVLVVANKSILMLYELSATEKAA